MLGDSAGDSSKRFPPRHGGWARAVGVAARRTTGVAAGAALVGAVVLGLSSASAQDQDAKAVVATVNGSTITAGDLDFALLLRRVGTDEKAKHREAVLEQLIDNRLMQEFLKERKAVAGDAEVAAQVERIHTIIKLSGSDPEETLAKLGLTESRLKQELSVPLAWQIHATRAIPDTALREHWQQRRSEYDGTQVRAAHIVLKVDAAAGDEAVKKAEATLKALRAEIVAGKKTFADAAKETSQGPSAENGGDVGFFPYRGKMPPAFSQAAFALKTGDVSEPVRTPFGVHLIKATERKTGDLSLEDVRNDVFRTLQQQLWNQILRDLRGKAKITRAGS